MVTAIVAGVLIVLHGLVHLLYLGHSARWFELSAGLTWPDGSWAFAPLGDEATRLVASIALVLAAAGFVAGGVAIFLQQDWWQPLVVASAAFSTILFLLFWDGSTERLDDQGGIAVLINLVILVAVLIWPRPDLEF